MKGGQKIMNRLASHVRSTTSTLAVAAAIALLACTNGATTGPEVYPTPEAAADAFHAALATPGAMRDVLGADFSNFIPTDGIEDEDIEKFQAAWKKQHRVIADPDQPDSGLMVVSMGERGWTLPIPLVKSDAGWSFDVVAGADEMRTRRIGRDEIAAIKASLGYYDAQREYARQDVDGDGFLEYAQRIISTPGKMDGLYWASLDDEAESPLGPFFGGDTPGSSYNGYLFRILKAQGPAAKGGAYDYVVDGHMRGGFGLIAWPVTYDDTGVMTFIVNQQGTVYEADLGPDSSKLVQAIDSFDPDERWTPLDPKTLE